MVSACKIVCNSEKSHILIKACSVPGSPHSLDLNSALSNVFPRAARATGEAFLAGCKCKLRRIFSLHCTVLAQSPQPLESHRVLIISSNCFVPSSSTELVSPTPPAPVRRDFNCRGCSFNPIVMWFVRLLGMIAAKQEWSGRTDRQAEHHCSNQALNQGKFPGFRARVRPEH